MIENQIVNKIIDYVLANIDEAISTDDIASYCGFSKFYLERIFKAETGETLYAFIKRVKVEQSAWRLKIEDRSITEIGNDYGYSSSNYSTLFKNHFEETPAQFRKGSFEKIARNPNYKDVVNSFESFEECSKKITIENLPPHFVLYERHKGNYSELKKHWCEFEERFKDFITPETIFIERTIDDPLITDSNSCLYEVCMTVDRNDPRLTVQKTAAAGITSLSGIACCPNTMEIEGGKFAVYHFKGFPQLIFAAYQSFFYSWLKKTGNRVDNRSSYVVYRKIDKNTMYMEMDICIPIK